MSSGNVLLQTKAKERFQKIIWDYYKEHKRDLAWRKNISAYRVLVSEIMLQQTQVKRVEEKYALFMKVYPKIQDLAQSDTQTLLEVWSGMGYNRRALYLRQIAQTVVKDYNGTIPMDTAILESFPGIGPATARSIIVYATNRPFVFIETNIRRIFIHHFFKDKKDIHDKDLLPVVEATMDSDNPREWCYALMDYGTFLTSQIENPNRKSKHYAVQSPFNGSDRQIRGEILRLLLHHKQMNEDEILARYPKYQERVKNILDLLVKDGFLQDKVGVYSFV